jgi:hypothetical protein
VSGELAAPPKLDVTVIEPGIGFVITDGTMLYVFKFGSNTIATSGFPGICTVSTGTPLVMLEVAVTDSFDPASL